MVGVGEHMFKTRGVEAVWCTQKGGGGGSKLRKRRGRWGMWTAGICVSLHSMYKYDIQPLPQPARLKQSVHSACSGRVPSSPQHYNPFSTHKGPHRHAHCRPIKYTCTLILGEGQSFKNHIRNRGNNLGLLGRSLSGENGVVGKLQQRKTCWRSKCLW